jgi:glutamate-ammonia-ligase adenylyltransferase
VAERTAQEALGFIGRLRRFDLGLEIDLRLRPEGGKGLLVRTYDGFGAYDVGDMEMWERFAAGPARLIAGDPDALELVRHAAYAVPLTGARLDELIRMKSRIELERVKPQHRYRDVKLGAGGLSDIEWIVHLTEMRLPAELGVGSGIGMPDRIRALGRHGILNALEVDGLLEARTHLLAVRNRLFLLQLNDDLVPENPDRLERLAFAFGQATANDFLRVHEPIVQWVRDLFAATLERLRS